ncbi:hypothetical protein Gpo141_00006157 [Globisporangium polare]
MAKICKPSSLFVAAAALALFASSSPSIVAAQDDSSGIERVNLDTDVLGAVSVPSDDELARSASEAAVPAVEERSADELAQSANDAAAPEERSADETVDAQAAGSDDAVPIESVASDADGATLTAAVDDQSESTEIVLTSEGVASDADNLTAEASGSATNEAVILGGKTVVSGWLDLVLDNNAVTVLVDALSAPQNYDPSITAPVCVLQINSGTTQTVSGSNYRYEILGCPINFADELGACRSRECASATYEVTVYQQTWTNTLQVSSIEATN